MLTPNQVVATRNGATALNAAARLLNEAVDELVESPVISNRDWLALKNRAERLSALSDRVSARAVKKNVFSTPV